MSGLSGYLPKSSLSLPSASTGETNGDGSDSEVIQNVGKGKIAKSIGSGSGSEGGGKWVFQDSNVATHLLRNAFGHTNADSSNSKEDGDGGGRLRKLLSIPAPLSRRFRDDASVVVLFWEDQRKAEFESES